MSKNRTHLSPSSSQASSDTAKPPVSQVTFFVLPRFNMATLITMIETMRIANYLSSAPIYGWDIVSTDGSEVVASNGIKIATTAPAERNRRDELLFVMGSWGADTYRNRSLFSWIRRQAREGAHICSVELGTYLVARAGLLSGHHATTHWCYGSGFQEQFDDITFVEQLFTIDGHVMTCSGGLAGVDLMLKLIGDAHGESLAGEIADQMMHYPIRPGSAPQRRTMGRGIDTLAPMVRDVITLIERHISEPPTVPEIARKMGVSQRQMERQFKHSIGCTVVQFGLLLRLQHARVLLISTNLSVREIAAASGFNTLSHFAYSFGKCFGRRPSEYRQAWPEKDAMPSWPGTLSTFLETLKNRGGARAMR